MELKGPDSHEKRFKFQHKPLISNECERKEDKTVDGSFEIGGEIWKHLNYFYSRVLR